MTITAKGRAAIIQKEFGLTPTVTRAIEEAILEHTLWAVDEAIEEAIEEHLGPGVVKAWSTGLDEAIAEETKADAAS
jgi:hypothetical protein